MIMTIANAYRGREKEKNAITEAGTEGSKVVPQAGAVGEGQGADAQWSQPTQEKKKAKFHYPLENATLITYLKISLPTSFLMQRKGNQVGDVSNPQENPTNTNSQPTERPSKVYLTKLWKCNSIS